VDSQASTRCIGKSAWAVQVRLGDFWIPQRGRFFAGSSYLEPFDETRHMFATSREGGSSERCMVCA